MATAPTKNPTTPKGKVVPGQRFGLLVVTEFVGVTPVTRKHVWKVLCDCGCVVVVKSQELLRGDTNSCGCLHREQTILRNREKRKYSNTPAALPEGRSWASAKDRCQNVNSKDYPRYGGRGISMCERWKNDFSLFLLDMGPRPPGTSLERINVNGNYESDNCRWATPTEQANNRRNTRVAEENGVTMTYREWGAFLGVTECCIAKRLKDHGSVYGSDTRRKGKGPSEETVEGARSLVLHARAGAD